MTADEIRYFDGRPQFLPLYEILKNKLEQEHPEISVKVSKTQISLRNRYVFAVVSLPWRKVKGWPKEYLLISFGLSYKKESPRIAQAVEAYPNRWTHHVVVETEDDIDEELMSWVEEAYQFAMKK